MGTERKTKRMSQTWVPLTVALTLKNSTFDVTQTNERARHQWLTPIILAT
jgi:hypothetical protein